MLLPRIQGEQPLFNEKVFENILGAAVRSAVTKMMPPKDALDYAQKIISHTFTPN